MFVASSAPKRILVVDDEACWRERIRTSLAKAGFSVLAASNGYEAMAKASEPGVALMIVDEDLGGESGVMLTKFLRRNHPGVPTFLHTSHRPDADSPAAPESFMADQYVPKESMDELTARVCRCLA